MMSTVPTDLPPAPLVQHFGPVNVGFGEPLVLLPHGSAPLVVARVTASFNGHPRWRPDPQHRATISGELVAVDDSRVLLTLAASAPGTSLELRHVLDLTRLGSLAGDVPTSTWGPLPITAIKSSGDRLTALPIYTLTLLRRTCADWGQPS